MTSGGDLFGEVMTDLMSRGGELTADQIFGASVRLGRIYGPSVMAAVHAHGRLTSEAAAEVVSDAWHMCEYPLDSLTQATWRELYDLAGYAKNGKPSGRPSSALTLYRGAPYRLCRRWAWTSDLETAERFARGGLRGRAEGQVWTASVSPERLLAFITFRQESEYVVDTRDLNIAVWPREPGPVIVR